MSQHRGRKLFAALALAALATGCGGGSQQLENVAATETPGMDTASPGMTPGATPPGTESPGTATPEGLADIERVGQAATEAVPGGTIIEMDAEEDGKVWDVTAVGEDGTAQAMKIDAETAKVTASPSPKPDVDKAKAQELVEAAKIDYKQAAEKILGEVPGGRLTKLALETEEESGKAVWTGEVTDEQGETREVTVDAETGDVMPAPDQTPGGEESPTSPEATPEETMEPGPEGPEASPS
ncbi:hypothetical protein GCM10010106_24540 [Thermopolyspora flexuosa]|jgi:uncharacterized membrane protein YkoI|uniref:Peptidase YpeB-like protein n=1 Tax=Thermopolyspora flexuosa TaxID=103836 RepID=A0A543IVG3_9ACTN|nr:PepSY domain-containing protein [Thermopolyspora flexuosa]TQM74566.1 peptidase YpeB-like protein [Thermopolyspora flexuosa]GGM77171.1 hypothetical protein GCM10010106_24540 [Thermopolyspora flexuosa]